MVIIKIMQDSTVLVQNMWKGNIYKIDDFIKFCMK